MKKSREPLPRSPLYQTHSATSPKSSPNTRGTGSPGTPLRVSALRHQFSEGSIPQNNIGVFGESEPPPQGTMSVQRRNLPPYSRPLDSEHMFDEDYFRQLEESSSSATKAALNDIPSPLEQIELERREEQLDWQVAWMRGHPMGHAGTGNNLELERRLRIRADKGLRDGTLQWVSGPPAKPTIPPPIGRGTASDSVLEIELPPSMQNLRTRPMGSRGASTPHRHAASPVHIPHHLTMGQQHASGLLDGSEPSRYQKVLSLPQYTPINQMAAQRQLTPTGQFEPSRQFSPINQLSPIGLTDQAPSFSHVGPSMPAGQYHQARQFPPFDPFVPVDLYSQVRQTSHAGPYMPSDHYTPVQHTQRRSTPYRQATPTAHLSSGSPVSRRDSSFSDMMSSTSSSRHPEDPIVSMARQSSPTIIPSGPRATMQSNSLHMPRSRPVSTPQGSNPYERNNQFMARTTYGQGVPAQRPTPPPAVGHGRPRSSEEHFRARRNMSRSFFGNETSDQGSAPPPPRQLPQWQRNQENSEEAAMSVLQNEMEHVRLGEEDRERDDEVMNNTPPHESIMERFLRED
jgi:hypothetical protein